MRSRGVLVLAEPPQREVAMGHLIYDGGTAEVLMDDRTLAHLQTVIVSKLRRQESFAFSWKEPAQTGDGRSTIWIYPTVSLRFRYDGSRIPSLNKAWLHALIASSHSAEGLYCMPEPAAGHGPDRTVTTASH
jgi:hypothetical protein